MRAKLLIYQYVKVLHPFRVLVIFIAAAFALPALAQMQKASLPDPVKFLNRREMVMRGSRAVIEQLGYKIELDDPKGGRLVTREYEFVSGALTSTEVDKIAIKTDSITGSWLRAKYVV